MLRRAQSKSRDSHFPPTLIKFVGGWVKRFPPHICRNPSFPPHPFRKFPVVPLLPLYSRPNLLLSSNLSHKESDNNISERREGENAVAVRLEGGNELMGFLRSGRTGKNNCRQKHYSFLVHPFHWFPVIPPSTLLD